MLPTVLSAVLAEEATSELIVVVDGAAPRWTAFRPRSWAPPGWHAQLTVPISRCAGQS
jgi:hypothetical protein